MSKMREEAVHHNAKWLLAANLCMTKYGLQIYLLTAPFWLVNRRVDGARATNEAAAAAATRILQKEYKWQPISISTRCNNC